MEKRLDRAAQYGLQEEVADGFFAAAVVHEPNLVAEPFEDGLQGECLEHAAVVGVQGEGQQGDFHGAVRVSGRSAGGISARDVARVWVLRFVSAIP